MSELVETEAAGFPLFHEPQDHATASAMAEATRATKILLTERWSLPVPRGCRLYVLTDWRSFVNHSAPAHLRPLLTISRPLWRARVERTFAVAGGWNVPWPRRPALGVKPPRLIEASNLRLGDRLFVPPADQEDKTRRLTCHELTHAFTAHLRLPPWLNEGLAMRAVDHLIGSDSVLPETRDLVHEDPSTLDSRAYRRVGTQDHDALLRLYAAGYWRTRTLDECHTQDLAVILAKRRSHREIERSVRTLLNRQLGRASGPSGRLIAP